MLRVLREDTRRGRSAVAVLIYVAVTAIYFACADRGRVTAHTPFNHFSLLAESWLSGHLHLPDGPPSYTGQNDFSRFDEKWFITFPAFPAVLLLPLVAVAGDAAHVRDGQTFLWLAGLAPAVLFLALERLRQLQFSRQRRAHNCGLSVLFALGTPYFFSAVQGTVWYAAHVVGACLGASYLLFALGAQRPLLAGIAVALGFHTRATLLFAVPLFALEALRVCSHREGPQSWRLRGIRPWLAALDLRRLTALYLWFALPIALALLLSFAHNYARFGDPFEVGYRFLQVNWHGRMQKWGLFSYHYFPRNLAVVLTSLPWIGHAKAPFQISAHGLALWFTCPFYFWLLWPRAVRRRSPVRWLRWALWLTVAAVGVPSLFYQNSGWVQFGYRFSNDYAVFLFALLAIDGPRMGRVFCAAAVWAIGWNAFGALSFERGSFRNYYHLERTQQVLHQPD